MENAMQPPLPPPPPSPSQPSNSRDSSNNETTVTHVLTFGMTSFFFFPVVMLEACTRFYADLLLDDENENRG